MAGSIVPISPAAVLVPMLVQAFVMEMGAPACQRRGIGKLRRALIVADRPMMAGAEEILASCCRMCGQCKMGRAG